MDRVSHQGVSENSVTSLKKKSQTQNTAVVGTIGPNKNTYNFHFCSYPAFAEY